MKKKSILEIKNHPSVLGMDITSHKTSFVSVLMMLTGILAPIGIILFVMGAKHRAERSAKKKYALKTKKRSK